MIPCGEIRARDPRIDPKAGDILRGPKSDRYVGRIYIDGQVGFTHWQLRFRGKGNDGFCHLKTWRKWAKSAEVIHCAD